MSDEHEFTVERYRLVLAAIDMAEKELLDATPDKYRDMVRASFTRAHKQAIDYAVDLAIRSKTPFLIEERRRRGV